MCFLHCDPRGHSVGGATQSIIERAEQRGRTGVLQFRNMADRRGKLMKTTTVLAIALGLGSLAACNKSPQLQAADNYEANVDNSADQMEANVGNAADQMTAN